MGRSEPRTKVRDLMIAVAMAAALCALVASCVSAIRHSRYPLAVNLENRSGLAIIAVEAAAIYGENRSGDRLTYADIIRIGLKDVRWTPGQAFEVTVPRMTSRSG